MSCSEIKQKSNTKGVKRLTPFVMYHAACALAIGKKVVAKHKEENDQKNSEKAAADKKHDGHTDSNPEKNETDHPLHNGLLLWL